MKPFPRARKITKWSASVLAAICLIVWFASTRDRVGRRAASGLTFEVGHGGFTIAHTERDYGKSRNFWRLEGPKEPETSSWLHVQDGEPHTWWFSRDFTTQWWRMSFPLWLPSFALLGAAGLAWRRDLLAIKRLHGETCIECGYAVKGLSAERCPECGTPLVVSAWSGADMHLLRCVKYGGVAITALLAAIWVMTIWYSALVVTHNGAFVSTGRGMFEIGYAEPPNKLIEGWDFRRNSGDFNLTYYTHFGESDWWVDLPVWVPLMFIAPIGATAWWLEKSARRRSRASA